MLNFFPLSFIGPSESLDSVVQISPRQSITQSIENSIKSYVKKESAFLFHSRNDNDLGLPENINELNGSSLGISFIKGLTKQLKGKVSIKRIMVSWSKYVLYTNNL